MGLSPSKTHCFSRAEIRRKRPAVSPDVPALCILPKFPDPRVLQNNSTLCRLVPTSLRQGSCAPSANFPGPPLATRRRAENPALSRAKQLFSPYAMLPTPPRRCETSGSPPPPRGQLFDDCFTRCKIRRSRLPFRKMCFTNMLRHPFHYRSSPPPACHPGVFRQILARPANIMVACPLKCGIAAEKTNPRRGWNAISRVPCPHRAAGWACHPASKKL